MARIRSIHPGLFTDEAFAAIPINARLFFVGLLCEADDQGVFEWKPITLKMRLFPADAVDVAALLAILAEGGIVRQFEGAGKQYGAIRNFCRYQRPKSPKAVHPLPDDFKAFVALSSKPEPDTPLSYPTDVTAAERKRRQRDNERDRSPESGTGHGPSVTNSELSRQMEDGGGNRKEAIASKARERAQMDRDFVAFWQIFPRREAKGNAEKAYVKARETASAEDLLAGAQHYALHRAGQERRYTRLPASWLNGKGWLDEKPDNVVTLGRPRDLREIRDPVDRARFQSF